MNKKGPFGESRLTPIKCILFSNLFYICAKVPTKLVPICKKHIKDGPQSTSRPVSYNKV